MTDAIEAADIYAKARAIALERDGADPGLWPEWDDLPAWRREAMQRVTQDSLDAYLLDRSDP